MLSFKSFINESHSFSSVQVKIPDTVTELMIQYADEISEDDLSGDGIETNSHITIKYGIHSSNPDILALNNIMLPNILHATMKNTSIFECDEFDVLKVDIDSEDMTKLNHEITDAVENTETHPEYHAHATIAYLKSGTGYKYIDDNRFNGIDLVFNEIEFSGSDDVITKIKLR